MQDGAENTSSETGQSSGVTALRVGTAVVIGAVAANVIAFRYSKWAVGKELYRAWERRQRQQSPSDRRFADFTTDNRWSSDEGGTFTSSSSPLKDLISRAFGGKEKMFESLTRERQEANYRADQNSQQRTKEAHKTWEARWSNLGSSSSATGGRSTYNFKVGSRGLEDLFRDVGEFQSHGRTRSSRDVDDIFEELLRAARNVHESSGRSRVNETFEFWHEVHPGFSGQREQWSQSWTGDQSAYENAHGTWHQHNVGHAGRSGQRSRALATLGLDAQATDADIKAAFRREVLKWHPDRYKGPEPSTAARRFREVTAAYDVLKKS